MSNPQNLKNHAQFDPLFHFVLAAFYLANLVFAIFHLIHHKNISSWWILALSLVMIIPYLKLRLYPLKVQDRVIRLEERLRLKDLSPVDWHPQINKLSEKQLISLRFASDEEVVALAQQALEVDLTPKQIKERIRNWRADYLRV